LEGSEKSETYRWVILVLVYLSILAFTFIFQSIPPILPLIISEIHINYAQSGLLMSLFALPGIFLSLPGGFLSDRYDVKVLGAVCFLWMICGTLLVGLGTDIYILWLGRIIAGMGALTLSVLLPKLLSQWFKDGELGLAMGIFNTGVPLGSAISFGLFGRLGNLWGWRIPILLTGIYSLIIAILFYTFYRRPPFQRMENGKSPSLYQSLKEMGLSIWGVGLSWLWFNAAFVSFATFAPNFFLQKDYTIEQSGLLIGTPLLGSLLFSAPIGYLVDRFKHQEWFIGIGAFALAFLTLFFNFNFSFLLLVIMMGVFSAMIPAPIYSLPPEILKIETVGLGFGVISTCSSIGMLGAPYFIGVVRDLTGADHWSFILISLFFLLTGVSILLPRCFPSIRSSEVKG
jgi:MFS family permease